MLVRFHSSTSGEILMFADSARTVLRLLAKDCEPRGVITAEQVPQAREALANALDVAHRVEGKDSGSDKAEGELPVGLAQRLVPMIELLERTERREGYVMWEAPGPFA